jgi:hypothetical protein
MRRGGLRQPTAIVGEFDVLVILENMSRGTNYPDTAFFNSRSIRSWTRRTASR